MPRKKKLVLAIVLLLVGALLAYQYRYKLREYIDEKLYGDRPKTVAKSL